MVRGLSGRYHLDGPRSGYDRVAVAPMEALLGHISLDRVIWIESMAEGPAAARVARCKWGAGARGGGSGLSLRASASSAAARSVSPLRA